VATPPDADADAHAGTTDDKHGDEDGATRGFPVVLFSHSFTAGPSIWSADPRHLRTYAHLTKSFLPPLVPFSALSKHLKGILVVESGTK